MQYVNQFTININEVARISFDDTTNINGEMLSIHIADVVMHIEMLKGMADFIYQTLEQHKKNTEETLKQAN